MVTGVGGTEGEAAATRALLGDDAVVVVEDFVDGYGYAEIGVGGEGVDVGVELFGFVVA